MINIQSLRENPEKLKTQIAKKGANTKLVDNVLSADEKRRKLIQKVEKVRSDKNKAAKEKDIEKGKQIKSELQKLDPQLKKAEEDYLEALNLIPNPPDDSAPVGKSDKENVEIKKWGSLPKFDFKPKDHLQIGKQLNIIDFDRGSKVAGSGFYYLMGDGAMLELALAMYGFEFLTKNGFTPHITPDLALERYYLGTGYLPKGPEAQIYQITNSNLGLIATAEVTLAGFHADETIPEKELPLRYSGYSHCFRQEAGAYGQYSKGLYRVHQFTKVEMFIYCMPKDSPKMHEEILSLEEKFWQSLEIPYRVLEMCTGDLGAIAAKKYDLEAWMPGRDDWGEITSTSNATDYQSRNLNIKYQSTGETDYLHLLNGTLVATSRGIISILENFQQSDGSVKIPKVLQKWMGKDTIK